MNSPTCNMPWDFSEVPKLVRGLLADAFGGHPFKVRRNKSEQRISISWELGPAYDEVSDFVWKTFPRIGYSSEWECREYDPPEMIDGRLLEPYFYSTSRLDLFTASAGDIPRLIAAGADIEERNGRGYTPFKEAISQRYQAKAIALLEAGASIYCCLPDGGFYEMGQLIPQVKAAVESRELATVTMPGSDGRPQSGQGRL